MIEDCTAVGKTSFSFARRQMMKYDSMLSLVDRAVRDQEVEAALLVERVSLTSRLN